ncbi:MAG: cytidylate kinase-like family protein [Ectothiorhodospiraceae bacterium]|jgi:cytidylate kinase|nr:cytidylate kinase-like family protein [Ectothiorhodospiraceae bacterium]
MALDPQDVIRTILKAEGIAPEHRADRPAHPPVIALSRDYGSGGEEIAQILADRLKVPCYDREILDAVAKLAGTDRDLMGRLDENVRSWKDTWIYSVLSGDSVFTSSYRHHLVDVLLAIARQGGIIVGRGGHVLLRTRPVFRVRIAGSTPACAERVAARENIDLDDATQKVERINHERAEFLWNLVQRRLNDATLFDLVVNTDRLHDWNKLAELILDTMAQAELPAAVSMEVRR